MDENGLREIRAARETVLARIAAAAKSAGRDPASITLTAVSKMQPDARIAAMWAAGQRVYGENRVQEAETRWAARRQQGEAFELRLIGPLQTNKAREAVALFDVIETLDRPKLAGAIADAAARAGRACTARPAADAARNVRRSSVGICGQNAMAEADCLLRQSRAARHSRRAGADACFSANYFSRFISR